MNWNKLQKGCSISMQLVSVIAVLIVTFFQFLKYKKEITNISISYNDGKQDLELPSITFCPDFWQWKQENITFEGYMKHVPNVSEFFVNGGIWVTDKMW